MSEILQTERLVLRELGDDDALFIFELLNEPGFLENIGDRGVTNLEAARGYIARAEAGYRQNRYGLWAMVSKAGGELVGMCGLVRREGLDHPDIGYALLERFWNQGFAVEAAQATLDHARNALGLETVVAITAPGNAASISVLKRIGLKSAGTITLEAYGGESAYFTT